MSIHLNSGFTAPDLPCSAEQCISMSFALYSGHGAIPLFLGPSRMSLWSFNLMYVSYHFFLPAGTPSDFTCIVQFVPKLFKFVTFPITALIETFWKSHVEDLDQGKVVEPCTIEFVSMLERTLNYAHTGNAAVLTKKLMDRAWLSLGLLIDGFPALSDAFIAHNALFAGQIAVRQDYWPVDRSTRRPLTSSQRCQELTYGPEYFEVCLCPPFAVFSSPWKLSHSCFHSGLYSPFHHSPGYEEHPSRCI